VSGLSTTSDRYRRRKFLDRMMTIIAYICAMIAVVPLALITIYVIVRGLGAWDVEFFTSLPKLFGSGGGVANGIVGTLQITGLAALMGVPTGVMAGIYLAEYGNNRLGSVIRFMADTMTGIPSIVAGLFAYAVIVLNMGFSAFAGAVSLAILMVPVITRTTEEIIRLVPNSIREASLALGVSQWKTTLRVVVPTALGGIVTGVLLSIARVAGETAPLILTILGTNFWNLRLFEGPTTTLSLQIYHLARQPSPQVVEVAWGASLLLILIVLGLSLAARLIFGRGRYVR
jgi:phosphate transport system permease protein